MTRSFASIATTKKAAIYVRVSTTMQIDKDSLSVQKREMLAYAQMVLGIDDCVIFEDPGFSAKNTNRPAYQQMMLRLKTGEFSHLLVWKIDRISRNLIDFCTMYEELQSMGVVFVSKNEQFDTSSAIGSAMLKFILVFAELERQTTSERVSAVMVSRAANGQWNGGRVPYGYRYDKETKIFSVDEYQSSVIRRIYSLYEQTQSIVSVVQYLNDNGIPTGQGASTWSPPTVHHILTNVFYVGTYRYYIGDKRRPKKIRNQSPDDWVIIKDHHEAIIDPVTFDRIQGMLDRNQRGTAVARTTARKNVHIFAGLVRCGECGSTMTATTDRVRAAGWQPSIYGCSTRRKSKTECSNKYISDVTMGPFVFNYVANIIRLKDSIRKSTKPEALMKKLLRGDLFDCVATINEEALLDVLDAYKDNQDPLLYTPETSHDGDSGIHEDWETLETQKRKIETALNRLKTLYLFGENDMPESEFIVERQKLMDELNMIDKRLDKLRAENGGEIPVSDAFVEKASYFIMVQKLLNDCTIDYERYIKQIDKKIPRAFILSIINRITVLDGKVISIEFKNGVVHRFTYKQE